MRILMVSDFYPPIIGGLEGYVHTLAHELVRRGHRVSVATLRHKGAPAYELDAGVHVHRLAGWHRLLAPFYESAARRFHPTVPDPGVMAGLRRVVARERPDVVHAHGWMLYSCLPLKEWSSAGLVVTLHDYGLVCPKKTYMHANRICTGPAYGKCLRCARGAYGGMKAAALTTGLYASSRLHGRVDRYLAVSAAVRDATMAGAPRPLPIEVIPPFISDHVLDEAAAAGRPAFLPQEDGYLLFVGALGVHKGLHVLLQAYAEGLAGLAPLVVIGTERRDTPARFPSGVTVVRDAPHAQVMASWVRCAVGVVPSIWPEPQPLVTLEAMACGRPIVASATGGLPEVVRDGETGLLVPAGDVSALREALRGLLRDPALCRRLGEAARQRARLFAASAVAARIERVYADVLARKAGGPDREVCTLLPAAGTGT
jgi:glycosyltransferase involved in cell wall biosynthesis